MVIEQGVRFIAAANHWIGREGQTPHYVIIHGTAGGESAEAIANYFAQSTTQASTNYVIGRDGTVICSVEEQNAPWANGLITGPPGASGNGIGNGYHDSWWDNGPNPNLRSVSIEHVKPSSDNSDILTPEQSLASFQLIKHICERWSIPMQPADASGGIVGHYSLDPVNRALCPNWYPWSALWDYVAGESGGKVVGIPDGWTDSNGTLKAPNGHIVVKGMRDYIMKNTWDADNWPVEDEQHNVNPVEMSNPKLGAGNRQRFNKGVLEYTTALGVFPAYVGPEMIAMEKRIHELSTQVTTLQAQLAKATGKKS